jgi:predicted nucleic acid-binding protein
MGAFALRRTLRRLKPSKWTASLSRRPDDDLPFATEADLVGGELLLDTCVYVDVLQKRAPPIVTALLRGRQVNHSSVCVAEMTHLIGVLDPLHPDTPAALRKIVEVVEAMPEHRVHTPTADMLAEAGMLAGMLHRVNNHPKGTEGRLLCDALVFLTGRRHGLTVLTGNIKDFDLLNQVVPQAGLLFYRRS